MEQLCKFKPFDQTFKEIFDNLPGMDNLSSEYALVVTRLKNLVNYNVPHRTEIRGYLIAVVFRSFCDKTETNEEHQQMSYLLGWCFQILQAYLTIIDDTIDDDDSRFGQLTWWKLMYKKKLVANDIMLLKHAVYHLLYKYFGPTALYVKLIHCFNQLGMEYLLGQNLNYHLSSKHDPEMANFTMKKWQTCVKYTIKKYVFAGPFNLAGILASQVNPENNDDLDWSKLNIILEQLTFYWATMDDLHDSFGVSLVNPLTHRDIIMGCCKWLIIKAKEVATPEIWKKLQRSYGKDNPAMVQQVLNIYTELGVPEQCKQYLAQLHSEIEAKIADMSKQQPKIGYVLSYLLKLFAKLKE